MARFLKKIGHVDDIHDMLREYKIWAEQHDSCIVLVFVLVSRLSVGIAQDLMDIRARCGELHYQHRFQILSAGNSHHPGEIVLCFNIESE